jgi:hypothetical protein
MFWAMFFGVFFTQQETPRNVRKTGGIAREKRGVLEFFLYFLVESFRRVFFGFFFSLFLNSPWQEALTSHKTTNKKQKQSTKKKSAGHFLPFGLLAFF